MLWRKNKCDNDSNGVFDFHDGVDNNRNYDFGWSIDTDPEATTPESLPWIIILLLTAVPTWPIIPGTGIRTREDMDSARMRR
jgi:hypothetical protein